MKNGMDPGILLLLGVVISGIVIAINGVVEMYGEWIKKRWPKTNKWPKGWVNFATGIIVALLALLGIRAWA